MIRVLDGTGWAATLEVIDEAEHGRVRVREQFGKANIIVGSRELYELAWLALNLARALEGRGR